MEKRRHQRVPEDLIGRFSGTRGPFGGRVFDLSLGGISFESSVELDVGYSFEVELPIGVRATAQVRHRSLYGTRASYGAVFTTFGAGGRENLRSHVLGRIAALGLPRLAADE